MARIGSGHYRMPGGIRRPVIDQAWYEMAAEIIGNSYATPDERLAKLNEIWGEFLLATNEYFYPRQCLSYKLNISDDMFVDGMDRALRETIGLPLEQIMNYAKEMVKNGTKETETAAPSPE